MSDHPEVPRFVINDDGESMNFEQAVAKFRDLLDEIRNDLAGDDSYTVICHTVSLEVYPCDCDQTLDGLDPGCPLHGEGTL